MRNQDYSILIRELKAGKESAFDSLFRLFYQDLCRFACSFLNDPMMAEDVVQGIFEKIWTRKKFIDESQQLDHYLYVSVRNACYTFLKNKKEHVKLDAVDSEDLAEPEADSVRTVTAVTGIPAMEEKNSAVHISVAAQVASLIFLKNCSDIVAVQTADEVPDSVDRTIMLNYNFHCVKPPKHTNKCLM